MDIATEFRALNAVIRTCASSHDQRKRWHELKAELSDAQRDTTPAQGLTAPDAAKKD